MFCLCMKKNGNFFAFRVLFSFYRIASINSLQATAVQFSNFCSSRLLFRIGFDNLLPDIIICPSHFDVLMISNQTLLQFPPVVEI